MRRVGVEEVGVPAVPLERLVSLLTSERAQRLWEYRERAAHLFEGRTVWNVNSTARGGGVAEMLCQLVGYGLGAGIDTRWLVLAGTPDFYTVTKRVHNRIHGFSGDDGTLDDEARATYSAALAANIPSMLRRMLRRMRPSLDPFSAKNAAMDPGNVAATVERIGWDRLKDIAGVLQAFTEHRGELPDDLPLILAGPEPGRVDDDPEGASVLAECRDLVAELAPAGRSHVHLWTLPMRDVVENARMVNALQRRATVVVQMSLAEGFGLTVTEPMWKAKAVVASTVGGIQDQIVDGVSGRLLRDPLDHAGFAGLVQQVLTDPTCRDRMGRAAHERVRDRFLADRHLIQYVDLCASLLTV